MSDTVAAPASSWTDTELSVRLRRGAGGAVRVDGVLCSAPVWFRWDGATLWLVGSGASPVGEDRIRVVVDVGDDVELAVRSVAATVVYAARHAGTCWDTEIRVGHRARVDWRPEPVILTARARHRATTTVHASATAAVHVEEVLVLGRTGEAAGSLRSTLDVRVGGERTLLTSSDTELPGWDGPGGTGGARVVANLLQLGERSADERATDARSGEPSDDRTAHEGATVLRPADGCRLTVAVGADVAEARRRLTAASPRGGVGPDGD